MSYNADDFLDEGPSADDFLGAEPAAVEPKRPTALGQLAVGAMRMFSASPTGKLAEVAGDPKPKPSLLDGEPVGKKASFSEDVDSRAAERLREQFASVPIENRLPALREYAKAEGGLGRAAQLLLKDAERENQDAQINRLLGKRGAEPKKTPSPGGSSGKKAVPMPEPGEIAFGPLDKNLNPLTDSSRAVAEAEATAWRDPNIKLDRLLPDVSEEVRAESFRKYAEQNPKSAALISGLSNMQRGARGFGRMLRDLAADAIRLESVSSPMSEKERELELMAQELMPAEGRQSMSDAWKKGQFGGWLGSNLIANSPQVLMSMGTALIPGAQTAGLGMMGAIATGGKYSETGDKTAATLSGLVEIASEKLPLDVTRRAYKALGSLEPVVRGQVLRSVANNLPIIMAKTGAVGAVNFIEETVAQVGNNAIDRTVLGQDKSLTDGALEAGVIGLGMGKAIAAPGAIRALTPMSRERALAREIDQGLESSQWAVPADAVARESLRGQAADPSLIPSSPLMQAPKPAPRVEDQPTTPMTPEAIATMAATTPAAAAPEQGVVPPVVDEAPKPAPILPGNAGMVGVANVGQGTLAQRAAGEVQQAAPTVQQTVVQEAPAQPKSEAVPAESLQLTNFKSSSEAMVYAVEKGLKGTKPVQIEPGRWGLTGSTLKVGGEKTATLGEIDTYTPEDRAADEAAIAVFNRDNPPARNSSGAPASPGVTLDADPSPEARVVRGISKQLFGLQLMSVEGIKGGNGLQFSMPNGTPVAMVRKGAPVAEMTIAVAGHEATHSLFRERPDLASKYQGELANLLRPGVVESRRKYEGKADDAAGQAYAAEEVAADVSGSMWLREDFWRKLNELDTDLFRGLRYKFMANMARMLDALGASKLYAKHKEKGGKDRFNLERLVTDVAAARDLTAKLWAAQATGKKLTSFEQKVDKQLDEALARYSKGDEDSRGVLAEVAPNPDQEVAKDWRELPMDKRQATTEKVVKRLMQRLESLTSMPLTVDQAKGMYEREKNPAVVIRSPGATTKELQELAAVVGYILDQKAMVAFDEQNTTSDEQETFVKVVLPGAMSTAQVESLRDHVLAVDPAIGGDHTLRDGVIAYGNFTRFGDNPISDDEFHDRIDAAVASFDWGGAPIQTDRQRFHSQLLWPEGRDGYLKETPYGEGNSSGAGVDRPGVRGRWRGDLGLLQKVAGEVVAFRDGWIDAELPAGRVASRAGSAAAQNAGGGSAEGVRVSASYGEAGREGAIEVDAFHFSQKERPVLIGAMHSSGLKGAERERLVGAPAALKQRIYLYFDLGRGIQPEAGVGGHLHGVRLRNVYDIQADKLGLVKQGGGINAIEKRIIDAGFDGYLTRDVYPTPNVVLLGPHSVKVDYLGTSGKFKAANTLGPANRMSRDDKWANKDWADIPDEGAFARMDELGGVEKISDDAYNLDALYADEKIDLQDELDAAMGQAPTSRPGVTPMEGKPADIKAAGLMMEEGMPPLNYQQDGSGYWARALVDGSTYTFKLNPWGHEGDAWTAIPDQPRGEYGEALRLNNVTEQLARAYNQRAAASIALHAEGYDLLSVVDRKQRSRIEKLWAELAQTPSAFEFETDIPAQQYKPGRFSGAAFVARAQEIADSMLAGSKYQFDINGAGNILNLKLRDQPDQEAQIELDDDGRTPRIYLHAIGLNKGSGAGKAFYQVAARIAKDFGVAAVADPQGLTAVNTYRRTEQMLSAALRNRDSSAVQPGYGQRIYGWKPGKAKSIQAENLIRLALANARNAKEAVPIADQLRYDLATGQFTINGESAEDRVTEALKRPDVRAMSVSRSTLARAALTFEAMQGDVVVPDVIDKPVLYSRDEAYTPLEALAADDYKAAEGRELVIRSDDASLRIDAAALLRDIQKRREAAQQLLDCLS